MSINVVVVCVVIYLVIAGFVFGKLDGTTPEPLRNERAIVAIFWPLSILLAFVVFCLAWRLSKRLDEKLR